ncbi:MAG TPA: cysteine hydrolase, partial [Gammaproteobacteria bacterium]|nr:cysteine hydrolase [Gammaproteobacteria bacterium]
TRRDVVGIGAAAGVAALAAGQGAAQSRTGRRVTIDAKPQPITIDTATTAVIVVDMQNDFGSKGGMFERAGIDISGIRKAVPPTARVLDAARKSGIKVVYLKMAYQPDLSDLGHEDSVNRVRHLALGVGQHVTAPDGRPSRVLVRDTWNSEIVDELKPHADDIVLYKTRFSGFYKTDLDERLRELGAKHLIITGCTTSICVESTVRDAMFRDYLCILMADCMDEPIGNTFARTNHDASLLSTEVLLGWVSDSSELSKSLHA